MKSVEDLLKSRAIREAVIHEFGKIPESILAHDRSDRAIDLMATERSYTSTSWSPTAGYEDMNPALVKAFGLSSQSCRNGALSRFPQNVGRVLVQLYTQRGDTVVDPFAGHNSRMELCWRIGRNYVGHDISSEFMNANRAIAEMLRHEAATDLFTSHFDATITLHECDSRAMPTASESGDFTITSPPYWNLEYYGDEDGQLGRNSYEDFLRGLEDVARDNFRCLKPGAFCVYCVNDFRTNGKFYAYHEHTASLLRAVGFEQHDTVITDLGQPIGAAFASQIVRTKVLPKRHEFCLIFRKRGGEPLLETLYEQQAQATSDDEFMSINFSVSSSVTTTPVVEPEPPRYRTLALSAKQLEAVEHLAESGGHAIAWWRVGEGKTRIALAWALCRNSFRLLIVCSPGAIRQWRDEIALLGLEDVLEVKFLSYGLLSREGASGKLATDFEALDCLIVDELWLYKNHMSIRSKTIAEFSGRLPTIGLSGSMITARNIEDLYGQARAVGIAHLVARNITHFRSQYEIETIKRFGSTQFPERTARPGAVKEIQEKLASCVHVHFPDATREIRDIDVRVAASTEQQKIKRELAKAYFYEHEDESADQGFTLEIKSAAALVVKLQQVSDGFLRNAEGEHLHLAGAAKLARLKELVSEFLDADERVIVWCAFRHSVDIIRASLTASKVPSVALSGDHKFDVSAWQSGRAHVCVATVGSGASLNDFAHVRIAVFYSTRFSHLQHQQARGRTDRASSVGSRCYYYMQTEGFPDAHVLKTIRESRDIEQGVIEITQAAVRDALAHE